MGIIKTGKIQSHGNFNELDDRITVLEDKYVRHLWFAEISSGTSGTITPPTGSTIVLDQWAAGVDAVTSTLTTTRNPTFESVKESDGTIITATLAVNGAWTISGTPSAYPIAILYVYEVKLVDSDRTKSLVEVETDQGLKVTDSVTFAGLTDTSLSASLVVVTDANKKLISGTNSNADLADAVTKRHVAVTVTGPISLSGQQVGLQNDAAAAITEVDTGALADSDTVAPTSKAVKTYADLKLLKASNLSDVADAATAFGNIKQVATTSATGVVELSTDTEAQTGTDTGRVITPANLRSIVFQHAKAQMLDALCTIIDPATFRLVILHDTTGAETTLTDRSSIGGVTPHTITLRDGDLGAIAASTMSPGVSGLAPYHTMDATHLWNANDADDLTFALAPFSDILLAYPTLAAHSTILGKRDDTTDAEKREYHIMLLTTGAMTFRLYDETANGFIGRTSPAASVAANTWQVIINTYDGTTNATGLKTYVNAVQKDNTTSNDGTFNSMQNTAALVGSYYLDSSAARAYIYRGYTALHLLAAGEANLEQITRLTNILLGYAGQAF